MSDTKEISEAEAIRQVIAESGAVDFVDVVNAVHKRFRMSVTAAQVEEVYHELAKETQAEPKARTSVTLTSMMSDQPPSESQEPELTLPTQPVPTHPSELPKDDLGHALHFVKSVGGLAQAKRTLIELESILLGSD